MPTCNAMAGAARGLHGQDPRDADRAGQGDPQLLAVATAAGRIAFATNCQPCHGAGGEGRIGYPSLADDTWLWGGTLADIQQTVTYGIRSGDEEARDSAMPRFGAAGILKPEQIEAVADYVWRRFYGHAAPGKDVAAGQAVFAENCAVCHGDNGEGNREVGAPPLKSAVHLYGDRRETIVAQVTNPRLGVMPNWNAQHRPRRGHHQERGDLRACAWRRRMTARSEVNQTPA